MTGREALFAGGGGAGLILGLLGLVIPRRAPIAECPTPEPAAEDAVREADANAGSDPAMIANANLAETLRDCSRQIVRLADEKSLLEQQISDERAAAADASRSAVARRIARRDLSQSDWKELALAARPRRPSRSQCFFGRSVLRGITRASAPDVAESRPAVGTYDLHKRILA